MYAVAAALAVDCVRQDRAANVNIIVQSLGQFVRKFLVSWLKRRGGWVSDWCCTHGGAVHEIQWRGK